MVETLIIYDLDGKIISTITGEPTPTPPVGVPYLIIPNEELQGKRIISVDTTVEPHTLVTEDIPPSDVEVAKADIQALQEENANLINQIDLLALEILKLKTLA